MQEFYDYLLDSETLYVEILEKSDMIDEAAQYQILEVQKESIEKHPYPKGISSSNVRWGLFLLLLIITGIWVIKKEGKECRKLQEESEEVMKECEESIEECKM